MTSPSVDEIIEAFGGVAKLARRLGVPLTTAHAWKRSGKLPSWRQKEIEAAAVADGVDLYGPPASPKQDAAA